MAPFDMSSYAPTVENWWSPCVPSEPTFTVARPAEPEATGAFVSLSIFTFILLLSPQNWIPALAPLRIAFLAAGAAIALLLWDRWKRRKPLLRLAREMVIATMLPVWAVLVLPLSYWPGGSMAILTDLYIKALMVFWLLANVVTTLKRLRFIAMLLVLCTVQLATTALKNFLTGKVSGSGAVERIVGYESALGSNPNDLALILNLIIPLGIALFLSSRRALFRGLFMLAVSFAVIGVIVTFSRGGFLGLATIGLVYFVKLIRRPGSDRSWAAALALIAILSLPFLPSGYVDRLTTITNYEADPTGSAQARWRDNLAAIQFVQAHPIIGAGIGMDILALNEVRGSRWLQIHNVYLQYAVDLGVPGLALFLMLFYGVFRAVRFSQRRTTGMPGLRDLFFLAEGVEVSLIVFAVAAFFHPVAYHFYFYYFAGLALATRSATEAAMSGTNVIDEADHEAAVLHLVGSGSRFVAQELP